MNSLQVSSIRMMVLAAVIEMLDASSIGSQQTVLVSNQRFRFLITTGSTTSFWPFSSCSCNSVEASPSKSLVASSTVSLDASSSRPLDAATVFSSGSGLALCTGIASDSGLRSCTCPVQVAQVKLFLFFVIFLKSKNAVAWSSYVADFKAF